MPPKQNGAERRRRKRLAAPP